MSSTFDDSGTPMPTPARMPPFDPEEAQVIGTASGRAIPLKDLDADRLRRIFKRPREWQPEKTDELRNVRLRAGAKGLTPASVLIPIVLREGGPTMLLTERTAHLNAHAGQVSFPGGSAEPYDVDVVDTALRETEEEIGLARAHVEVIGRLPDHPTVTGFNVAPIIALVHPPFTLKLDEFEVAEAFELPLTFLLDPANHQRREIRYDDVTRHFTAMPHGKHFVWGATAAMLRNLYLLMAAQADD